MDRKLSIQAGHPLYTKAVWPSFRSARIAYKVMVVIWVAVSMIACKSSKEDLFVIDSSHLLTDSLVKATNTRLNSIAKTRMAHIYVRTVISKSFYRAGFADSIFSTIANQDVPVFFFFIAHDEHWIDLKTNSKAQLLVPDSSCSKVISVMGKHFADAEYYSGLQAGITTIEDELDNQK